MTDTMVFDVDGTLVDTNYHHALAWFRAFQRFDLNPPVWRIHRAIGMGGDQLVAAVTDDRTEQEHGDGIRDAWTKEYNKLLPEVRPFEGARDLLVAVRESGTTLVLASSAPAEHVDHYLDLLDARELAQSWITAEDAEETKPAPDLVQTAMAKGDSGDAVMVGDSTWDCKAAARAGITSYAVLTGGFSVEELKEAGAREVYDSLQDLHSDLRRLFAG